MRRINKKSPPKELVKYGKQVGASYNDIDKAVYDATLKKLLDEQGWICGYCQQIIKTPEAATIEHFCERSICNGKNGTTNLTLSYSNMMAVCKGEAFKDTHCDKKKSQFRITKGLPIEVSPCNLSHMNAVSYTSSGKVKSSIPRHDTEIDKILNLNIDYLKKRRKQKYTFLLSTVGDLRLKKNREKLKKLIEVDNDMSGNKFKNSFPGLSEYMIKFCK